MTGTELQEAAALAELAAAIYLKPPAEELLAGLRDFFMEAEELSSEAPDLLLQEYHELFFNPASQRFLCPFESFAREGRYRGKCSVDVGTFYQQAGFDPATLLSDVHWKNQRMPDHIGFELAFFSALLRSAEAQPEEADALLESARAFHAAHIRSWAGDFGTRLGHTAGTSLYRLLGALTREIAEFSPDGIVRRG